VSFRDEDQFVRWLQQRWPRRAPGVSLGVGDDAAIVRPARRRDVALTTDLSVEGVHFHRDLHPPRAVGHRALARALSDLAAMGARARFALLSIAFPPSTSRAWLSAVYDGIGALARRSDVALIGGDTTVAEGPVSLDVVAVGDVNPSSALRRDGARLGDLLYVTGRLGMAALGLELLRTESGRVQARSSRRHGRSEVRTLALNAHLFPEPRLSAGRYLAERRLASAAIDASDGFARDLGRLCAASGCAAAVYEDRLPCPPAAAATRLDRVELALRGGEDYELIFTVPPSKARRLPKSVGGVPFHEVGEIRRGRGLRLIRVDGREAALSPHGYDHFRRST
jgi:thiamine-monophosphate kinase